MNAPGWYATILIALAAYSTWRLVARDELTTGARRRILGIGDEAWSQWEYVVKHVRDVGGDPWEGQGVSIEYVRMQIELATGRGEVPPLVCEYITEFGDGDKRGEEWSKPPTSERRWWLNQLVRCPWCLGSWLALAWWGAWQAYPDATLAVASLAAARAIVGLIAARLDPA